MLFTLLTFGCITPIDFNISEETIQLVVEGRITNQEPPYIVKLSRTIDLSLDTLILTPESGAQVILYDDAGNTEILEETDLGTYETNGIIQGTLGRSYYISIETINGGQFESEPEMLNPVGTISEIRYEFERRKRYASYGQVDGDVFNIFIDANGGPEEFPLIRWRMTGIYGFETFPQFHMTETPPYTPYKDPWPCSGYIVVGGPPGSGGILEKVGPCTCCECWGYQYVDLPQLSDDFIVEDGQYQNVKVGEVPVTNYTFHEKYQVIVEQTSLSQEAFDYYKSLRNQKLGASDLFQTQIGELKGNMKVLDDANQVVGLFYAASITNKEIYITRDDIPYPLVPMTFITLPCYDVYLNSTNKKPGSWID